MIFLFAKVKAMFSLHPPFVGSTWVTLCECIHLPINTTNEPSEAKRRQLFFLFAFAFAFTSYSNHSQSPAFVYQINVQIDLDAWGLGG